MKMLSKPEEIRALTMMIIDRLGSEIETSILQPAVIATCLVEMTDYYDCVESLNKDNLIYILKSNGAEKCGLTKKGKSIVGDLADFIPEGIREEALRCAWRYYEALVNGVEYFCNVEKCGDGGAYVITGVIVNKKTTCEVKTYFTTEKEAYEAKNNCEKRPQAVVNTVLAAVTGDVNFIM